MKIRLLPCFVSLAIASSFGCVQAASQPTAFHGSPLLGSLPGLNWLQRPTPIAQLGNRSTSHLQGQVQQHVPLLDQWLYQLQDGSGHIWVLTSSPPPAVGSTVSIQAVIHYEPIPMGGEDVGEHYAEEQERVNVGDAQ